MITYRVIITGATGFDRYGLLSAKCRKILSRKINRPDTEVIILSGDSRGAERLGLQWAEENRLKTEVYEITEELPFKEAEASRCQRMIDDADALIAFDWPPYPNCHMLRLVEGAKKKGIPYRVIG